MDEEIKEEKIVHLRIDDIIPNRFQPREVFDQVGLQELSDSIKEHGVIQPIIVRQIGDKYELIAGERRIKASAMAGLTTIPALIKNIDDKESAKLSLLENLQRKNLNAIEEARTYKRILDLDNITQEKLARTIGRSQPMVANKLRLLALPIEVQDSLMKNEISERHARSLLSLKNKKSQLYFLKKIKQEKMTVRKLEKEIKEYDENQDIDNNDELLLEENKEGNNMNNNRTNFGGMGLNDYQTSVYNNNYNSVSNNFNNMQADNQYDYNNMMYQDNNYVDPNSNQYNNTTSLGSMLDNNMTNQESPDNNGNLFVSNIREDNLPKVENQFLPNFDENQQNFNDMNNQGMNDYNMNNQGMNNYDMNNQGMNNYDMNNQGMNDYNMNNQGMNNYNMNNQGMNDYNMNNPGMNDYNMNNQGMNDYNMNNQGMNNYNMNNQGMNYYNMNNQGMNDYNMNNQGMNYYNMNNQGMMNGYNMNNQGMNYYNMNNQGMMNGYNMNNPGMMYNNGINNYNSNMPINNYNSYNGQSIPSSIPDYNMAGNYSPLPNQGNSFNQPLNIIDVPHQEEFENYNDNHESSDDSKEEINNNSFEDNDLFDQSVSISSNEVDESPEIENEIDNQDIEVIGEKGNTSENPSDDSKNEYIRLEQEDTIKTTRDAVLELKKTTDRIKQNHIEIDTEEIDYDDVYQIVIKIKKEKN